MEEKPQRRSKKKRRPYYKRQDFWLSMDNNQDIEILQLINKMKGQRKFSSSIRRGLRLIEAIDSGDMEWIYTHYPFLVRESLDPTALMETMRDELRNLQMQLLPTTGIPTPTPLEMPDLSLGGLNLNARDDDFIDTTQNYLDQIFNF